MSFVTVWFEWQSLYGRGGQLRPQGPLVALCPFFSGPFNA